MLLFSTLHLTLISTGPPLPHYGSPNNRNPVSTPGHNRTVTLLQCSKFMSPNLQINPDMTALQRAPFAPSSQLTCVLSELVHGLKIYDVGREPAVHLAEHHAPSAGVAAPDGRLYLVGDGGAVGPPPAVFVQPFPHHHGRGQEHVVTVGPGGEKHRWNDKKTVRSSSAVEVKQEEAVSPNKGKQRPKAQRTGWNSPL